MAEKKPKPEKPAKAAKPAKPAKPKSKGGGFNFSEFLFLNIEKILFAVVLVVALWLGVTGMSGYTPLSWQPDALSQAADQADKHIREINLDPQKYNENLFISPYDQKAEWIKVGIKQTSYLTDNKWEPTLFPDKVRRGEPKIFPVVKLRAEPGCGAIAVRDTRRTTQGMSGGPGAMSMSGPSDTAGGAGYGAGGTVKTEGKRWIIVTGLIPIQDQLKEYMDTYYDAMYTDPTRDTPRFITNVVERCEFDPTLGENQKWVEIDTTIQYQKDLREWSGIGGEQVDRSFIAPQPPNTVPMAYHLPPLGQRLFGDEVAYPPYIPLLMDSLVETIGKQEDIRRELTNFRPVPRDELLKLQLKTTPRGGAGNTGGTPGGPGSSSYGGSPSADMGGSYGSSPAGGMGGVTRGIVGNRPEIRYEPPKIVDHYLFRYFDFDVEEDKTYQYRVKLILMNPNINLHPKVLEKEEYSTKTHLESDFSAPSHPVTAGRLARILLTRTISSGLQKPWEEPKAVVMPIRFEMEDAIEWVASETDISLLPGQVANFKGKSCYNPAPQRLNLAGPGSGPGPSSSPGRSGAATRPKAETKTLDMISDVCLIDVYGGYQLDGAKVTSPGKVLLMDTGGGIVVKDVIRDNSEVVKYQKPTPPSTSGPRR